MNTRRWLRAAAGLSLPLLGAATCEQPVVTAPANFAGPQAVALVCLHKVANSDLNGTFCPEDLDGDGNPLPDSDEKPIIKFETVSLDSCNRLQIDEIPEDNPTATKLANSFLFALVTNVDRGDVG